MKLAEIQATLKSKLSSLTADIANWRDIVEEKTPGKEHRDFQTFTRHQSQVVRLADLFHGMAHTLCLEIEQLDEAAAFEGSRKINYKVLQGHALWSYFRNKLLFRYSAPLRRYLLAADEYAWACYRPFLIARQEQAKEELKRVPPLLYLGRNVSPLVFPRQWTLENEIPEVRDAIFHELLKKAPFAVVSLPFYQTKYLPEMTVLAHEMGHVVEFDFDLSATLEDALDAALAKIPETPGVAARRATWKRCRVEAFADAFGAAAGGLGFCRALAAFLADSLPKILQEPPDTSPKYAYPGKYLRVLLALEVVRRNGSLSAAAAKLLEEWQKTYGNDHPFKDYEADLPAVVAALIDTSLPQFGDRSIRQLVGLSKSDDEDAAETAANLLKWNLEPSARNPRVLVAAATLAYHDDAQKYADIGSEGLILRLIEKHADNAPRKASNLPPTATSTDFQQGESLAALLGQAPAD